MTAATGDSIRKEAYMPAPKGKKSAEKKNERGRPTKYKKEYSVQVEKLCKLGATDKEIADFFEVTEQTINNWKTDHSDFFESIKKGKLLADAEVAEKLFQRATGYSHPDVHISSYEGSITVTDITKHYPPDPTSGIFWLKNRQPAKWRDKPDVADDESQAIPVNVTVNVVDASKRNEPDS
jgi:hypothetical protein